MALTCDVMADRLGKVLQIVNNQLDLIAQLEIEAQGLKIEIENDREAREDYRTARRINCCKRRSVVRDEGLSYIVGWRYGSVTAKIIQGGIAGKCIGRKL